MDEQEIQRIARIARNVQRDFIQQAVRIANEVQLDAAVRTVVRTARELQPALEEAARASAAFFEVFASVTPPNWKRLTHPQIFDAVELMSRTGWCLIWTPPSEVIVGILEAPTAENRRQVLLAAEGKILDDLEMLLEGIEKEELLHLRDAVEEARQAHLSGFFKASQSLSAATLSTTLHEQLREKSHGKVAEAFRRANEEEAPIRDFRWIAVQGAVAKTLEDYQPVKGIPERSDFNRHATAHRVKEPQYRQVNSLSALMLLTGLLLEIESLPNGTD